jgi:hypothetical protein
LRKSSDKTLQTYLMKNNQSSIDGLPALSPAELENVVIQRE